MYILSRYCHPFVLRDKIIFFHALNFEQVITKKTNFNISSGLDPEFINSLNQNTIDELLNKKMLIRDEEEDLELLNSFRAYIKKPYISTAYFFLTNDCNLACKYCFEKQSVPDLFRKEKMTKEVFHKGLDFYVSLIKRDLSQFNNKKTIIFYGGEPFMNRDVLFNAISTIRKYIADGILPKDTFIIVVTNGVLLKQSDIDFIKANNVTLTFSIDGSKKATQNRVFPNKEEAFDIIVERYKKCRDAGISLNVACTLTPETIENFQSSMEYFINELKITNVGFNALLDNGIIEIPSDYNEKAAQFIVDAYCALSKNDIRENRSDRRINVFRHKKPCVFDCNAQGGRQIAIAPGGEVGVCHEHIADRKHFVTNIYEDFVPEEDPTYLEWNKRSPLFIEKCYTCPALGICGGGCVINTETQSNSIWEPDPRFCQQTLTMLHFIIRSVNKER